MRSELAARPDHAGCECIAIVGVPAACAVTYHEILTSVARTCQSHIVSPPPVPEIRAHLKTSFQGCKRYQSGSELLGIRVALSGQHSRFHGRS
jgi:hypothetical protein